ncbi:hypothetical protein GCM10022393_11530 [Aquimarina addita]|uniref:CpeT/CpcT family protein DUF1001 n=1 Tax=Aquimarina addita TaxID=870485 RepID=A0ABP7XDQ3_9FLAO
MQKLLLFLISVTLLLGCNTRKNKHSELEDFISLLSGKFSSSEQAKKDSSYSKVCFVGVPIWKNKPGHWLYQELHNEDNPTVIYYQRIINIKKVDSVLFSTSSYVIPNKKKYSNGWKDISIFDTLSIDSLQIRDGCDVYFEKKTSSIYQGKTKDKNCISSSGNKPTYITSHLVISADKITSWDRGYSMQGKQVWGKIQGPYRYKRITN